MALGVDLGLFEPQRSQAGIAAKDCLSKVLLPLDRFRLEQRLTLGATVASGRAQACAEGATGAGINSWDFRVLALFVYLAARVAVCT